MDSSKGQREFNKFRFGRGSFIENSLQFSACRAFNLIELLVVMSIISLLISITVPALGLLRVKGRQLYCRNNLRQLVLANDGYAHENDGSYVPGSTDIFTDNLNRWFGARENISEAFDVRSGPLAEYINLSEVKCPVGVDYMELDPIEPDYEAGSGGYGYNLLYVGSKIWLSGYEALSCKAAARNVQVMHPAQTLMFADTAISRQGHLVEYSFAEPRYFVTRGEITTTWDPEPSIHFRHRERANVGWADGHTSSEKMGRYDDVNNDGTKPSDIGLGWFEPVDNSMFDLK